MSLLKNLIKSTCSLLFCVLLNATICAQGSIKKNVVLTVCIDGNSKLHIKHGKMFWEHLQDFPPGKHNECLVLTNVNGKRWDDWKSTFLLDFNTDSFSVAGTPLILNEISKLVQSPTADNGWETIWWFNDPSAYPHSYEVAFEFVHLKEKSVFKSPAKVTSAVQKPKSSPTKKDTTFQDYIPNNISFEVGNAKLTIASFPELDKIYESLKLSTKRIAISGHTNNVGEKEKLQKLSEDRALTVYNYLFNKGLSKERMSFHGYGDSRPIVSNDTEEGRSKNRRVEIKIIK